MKAITTVDGNDLVITRRIAAAPQAIWDAWTDADTLAQWWAPRPWRVTRALIEPCAGGRFVTAMQGPDGEAEDCPGDADSEGCILEAVEPRRIVFTDAMSGGYRPNATPFMTAIITIDPDGDGTIYTARVLHRTQADRQRHQDMGFAEGWGTCIEQLAGLVE